MLKFKLHLKFESSEFDHFVSFDDYAAFGRFIASLADWEGMPSIVRIERVKEEENNAVH